MEKNPKYTSLYTNDGLLNKFNNDTIKLEELPINQQNKFRELLAYYLEVSQ